jgi:hypothetical protein
LQAQASAAGAKPLSRPAGQHAGGEDHIDFSFGAADGGDTCAVRRCRARARTAPGATTARARACVRMPTAVLALPILFPAPCSLAA